MVRWQARPPKTRANPAYDRLRWLQPDPPLTRVVGSKVPRLPKRRDVWTYEAEGSVRRKKTASYGR